MDVKDGMSMIMYAIGGMWITILTQAEWTTNLIEIGKTLTDNSMIEDRLTKVLTANKCNSNKLWRNTIRMDLANKDNTNQDVVDLRINLANKFL